MRERFTKQDRKDTADSVAQWFLDGEFKPDLVLSNGDVEESPISEEVDNQQENSTSPHEPSHLIDVPVTALIIMTGVIIAGEKIDQHTGIFNVGERFKNDSFEEKMDGLPSEFEFKSKVIDPRPILPSPIFDHPQPSEK